jgi:hypothetical protein
MSLPSPHDTRSALQSGRLSHRAWVFDYTRGLELGHTMLGTAPDQVIARLIGVTPLSVLNRRRCLQREASRKRIPSLLEELPALPSKLDTIIGTKPIHTMSADEYGETPNLARSEFGGPRVPCGDERGAMDDAQREARP